jgi:hypothetical protein
MSNLISINKNIVDMKRHMLIAFSYPCWWVRTRGEIDIKIKESY